MDQPTDNSKPVEHSPVPAPSEVQVQKDGIQKPASKSNKFFITFGKVVLILLVVGVLIFAGYYLGTSKKNSETSPTPSPTKSVMEPTQAMKQETTPTTAPKKTVKAGLTDGSTSFKPYSIEIPSGWVDNHETTNASDKLTITKNDYSLTIYQAALGGGGCIYKGDPPADQAQSFTDYVQISGSNVEFRRSWNPGFTATSRSYIVCQKANDNSYGSLTTFGSIAAESPNPTDSTTMSELDSMVASLKQQ